MKNFLTCFLLTTITIAALLGCKKEITEETSVVEQETVIQKLKSWNEGLSAELKSHTVQIKDIVTTVTEVPDWSEAKFYADKNMVIAPVKIGDAKSVAPVFKYLVAKSNAKGEITDVNYYKIFSGDKNGESKFLSLNNAGLIPAIIDNKNIPGDFTGRMLKYNSGNKLLTTYHYENGALTNTEGGDKQNDTGNVVLPNMAPDCQTYIIDSWWVTYNNGVVISIEYLYSTSYMICSGGGGSNPPPAGVTTYIEGSITDNFFYTCPDNFAFTGITTSNLWQEAGISNAYCNLIYYNARTQQRVTKIFTMPTMYFGLPYLNQSGGVIFSSNQAKVRAANAFNDGELAMRRYFKNNPNATDAELQNEWIRGAEVSLQDATYGQGRVSKYASSHPIRPVIVKSYGTGCS